jgi:CubicO group peptidase (beta-lactamase class C family)
LPLLLLGTASPAQDAGFYKVTPDSAASETALRSAVDAIFDAEDMGSTRALLVLHDGRIVAERYAPGFGPDNRLVSWSMAKTVTAVLIGLLVSDGRLALDAPAPVPAWSQPGDPRGAITLRQLLTMSSGLDHVESGQPLAAADTNRMLFVDGAQDWAGYAEAKPLADPPGSAFRYSTATTMILADIATRMLTDSEDPDRRRAAMTTFIDGRLKAPAGLASLTPEFDARGTLGGGSFMHMTARDYARFGEFLRNRGRAQGRQVLSERWVSFMTTPSRTNPAYGGQLWLNREGPASELFAGEGPTSVFGCVGHNGQYILVSPSQRLTVVRLGISTGEERVPLRHALARLMAQFPA